MSKRKTYGYVVAGLLIVTAVGISYAIGRYVAQTQPKHVTIHVSGATGTRVSTTFEVDGVEGAPDEGVVPTQFTCTGHKVSFTVRRLAGPDQPICAAVQIDGVPCGTGTAAGGVCGYIWKDRGGAGANFRAVPSEPEWKETKEPAPGPNRIGTQPPEWTPMEWLNAQPLRLAELRGRVVLARWFTGPHCQDCSATAPALREFHERYQDLGLTVVGMFFHADDTVEQVRDIVAGYGYQFPVGIDRGARTRRLWSLGRYDYGFTSVTFLLDRQGIIRHIHHGGRYVKGDADYRMLQWEIERCLGDRLR